MRQLNGMYLGVLLLAAALAGGCGNHVVPTSAESKPALAGVVREGTAPQKSTFDWTQQKNIVLDVTWLDYRHGDEPVVSRRLYTIDLVGKSLRIDNETDQSVALYDGEKWRVFIRGTEITKPEKLTEATVGSYAALEYAAGDMRTIRTLLALSLGHPQPGMKLESLGEQNAPADGTAWSTSQVIFDQGVTGRLKYDEMVAYFYPASKLVGRALFTFVDAPFCGIPHWGQWSQYERLSNGLVLAHRIDFHVTDAAGKEDRGRHLSLVINKVAFNASVPTEAYASTVSEPRSIVDQPEAPPETTVALTPGRTVPCDGFPGAWGTWNRGRTTWRKSSGTHRSSRDPGGSS